MRYQGLRGSILFHYKGMVEPWREAFAELAPQMNIRLWPEWDAEEQPEFALVWKPPPGELARYPSLKIIFSLGAGLDHLWHDPSLPTHVPIVRMVDPTLTRGMTEFVVMSVLYHHRDMLHYARCQRRGIWEEIRPTLAADRVVGIMGVGELGRDVLAALDRYGFKLRGWSRSQKQFEGVRCFAGDDEFQPFLDGVDILVCLLPLTDATRGILSQPTLTHLAPGAAIINVGRGEHMVAADVLDALDSGALGGATLDVFPEEPLPSNHPLWGHDKVVITPHIASMTLPTTAAGFILDQIAAFRRGDPLTHVCDPERGY